MQEPALCAQAMVVRAFEKVAIIMPRKPQSMEVKAPLMGLGFRALGLRFRVRAPFMTELLSHTGFC